LGDSIERRENMKHIERRKTMKVFWNAERERYELDAPCGCYSHPEKSLTGHPYCQMPADEILDLEEMGLIHRFYDDLVWRWVVNDLPALIEEVGEVIIEAT
jgi:hypothetical protein